MFIRKNVRLIKILSLCLTSTILASTATAGGMETKQNPLPPQNNVPPIQPPAHSSDGYPSAPPVPNGAFPIQDPGPYQGDLLPPSENYPDVGLRKETNADCYCDNAYFKIGGSYVFNERIIPLATKPSVAVDEDADVNFPIRNVVNPGIINRAIYGIEPKGVAASSNFVAGYKGGSLRAEFQADYGVLLGEDVSVVNGAVTYAITPNFVEYSGMLNGYFDYNMPGQSITPYIGAGIGLERRNLKYDVTSTSGDTVSEGSIEYKHTGVLAAGMVGASLDLTKSVSIDVGYRMKKAFGGEYKGEGLLTNGANVGLATQLVTEQQTDGVGDDATSILVRENLEVTDQTFHEINVGVRYRF